MRAAAHAALLEPDPARKVALTEAAWRLVLDRGSESGTGRKPLVDAALSLAVGSPGRPAKPALLHPAAVPTLAQAIQNRDNWVGSAAARVLGRIGAEAKVVEAALTEALQDEDERVRISAAQWLQPIAAIRIGSGAR